MSSYRAIVIDDEKNIREVIQHLLKVYCPDIILLGMAASAHEGRKLLLDNQVDFIFLDISMPKEDGFSFLTTIEMDKYGIVFITAHQEFALRAIKANAIDYLLKPINPEEFVEAVEKAIKYHEARKSKQEVKQIYSDSLNTLNYQIQSNIPYIDKITIADQYGFRIVKLADLMYLQADSNYTILHISGLEKIVVSRSIGEFERIINNPAFFRIHKSTIINLNFLRGYSSYQGNFAELTDGTRLSISRRKVNEFRDAVGTIAKSII